MSAVPQELTEGHAALSGLPGAMDRDVADVGALPVLMGKALVTGAAGFTGQYLVRALQKRGVQVRALVRHSGKGPFAADSGIEVVGGDLTNPREVERAVAGCDFVFHLAAVHRDGKCDDRVYRRVNVDGTHNVAEAAARAGVRRFVHCSTAALHDSAVVPAYESVALVPEDVYESS
ncbi:MAG: NAD-dependent epimerase/dehydratase family protein, partial [Gammaproteobacteria bacterium]|nr:NAD-dependent epimerase/dehydratase family protein [Gammaproteobacteria bacterium]